MSFLGSGGLEVQDLCVDEGRQVYLVQVPGAFLVVKYFDSCRLEGNTAQVFNELRARISPLRNCHYLVLPLHVSISLEGGMLMVYPFAGRNMDTVCAELRADGCKDALVKQLAQMATSVILVLQKLQSQKPKPLVHKDVKLENLLLGEDSLVRLADFGNLGEDGDLITAHDPNYFPPDWAAFLPDGRHVFEDPTSLAAANNLLLDLRGLGMALIKGYAGHLPREVSLEDSCTFTSGQSSSCSSLPHSTVSTSSCTMGPRFDAEEKARLVRIAQHDWAASIDTLIPDAPALNQFAKLLMGPREEAPSLNKLLQQPFIKSMHRHVLDTARKARKPWTDHVVACRAAVWQVATPLMQLEEHLLPVQQDGSIHNMPSLRDRFELLNQQSTQHLAPLHGHSLEAGSIQGGAHNQASGCGACLPFEDDVTGTSRWSSDAACSPRVKSSVLLNAAAPHSSCCTLHSESTAQESLPAAPSTYESISAALLQLAASRPAAAARIAELRKELYQLATDQDCVPAASSKQPSGSLLISSSRTDAGATINFGCALLDQRGTAERSTEATMDIRPMDVGAPRLLLCKVEPQVFALHNEPLSNVPEDRLIKLPQQQLQPPALEDALCSVKLPTCETDKQEPVDGVQSHPQEVRNEAKQLFSWQLQQHLSVQQIVPETTDAKRADSRLGPDTPAAFSSPGLVAAAPARVCQPSSDIEAEVADCTLLSRGGLSQGTLNQWPDTTISSFSARDHIHWPCTVCVDAGKDQCEAAARALAGLSTYEIALTASSDLAAPSISLAAPAGASPATAAAETNIAAAPHAVVEGTSAEQYQPAPAGQLAQEGLDAMLQPAAPSPVSTVHIADKSAGSFSQRAVTTAVNAAHQVVDLLQLQQLNPSFDTCLPAAACETSAPTHALCQADICGPHFICSSHQVQRAVQLMDAAAGSISFPAVPSAVSDALQHLIQAKETLLRLQATCSCTVPECAAVPPLDNRHALNIVHDLTRNGVSQHVARGPLVSWASCHINSSCISEHSVAEYASTNSLSSLSPDEADAEMLLMQPVLQEQGDLYKPQANDKECQTDQMSLPSTAATATGLHHKSWACRLLWTAAATATVFAVNCHLTRR